MLTVQLATVWLSLRTSKARPRVRLVADIGLSLAAVAVGKIISGLRPRHSQPPGP